MPISNSLAWHPNWNRKVVYFRHDPKKNPGRLIVVVTNVNLFISIAFVLRDKQHIWLVVTFFVSSFVIIYQTDQKIVCTKADLTARASECECVWFQFIRIDLLLAALF